MATANKKSAAASAVATPWYDLIGDPEPPEDGMQQEQTILDLMSILKARYEDNPTVLYANQTFVIYDSNVPGSVVAPDGFIVFGVDARQIKQVRNSYRIDEWGQTPAFVMEVASESTAPRDLHEKREIYTRMKVQEYWRFDRMAEYYGEPLVGERLVDGEYQRFEFHHEANGDIWSRSEVLGVDFVYRVEEGVGGFLLRDSGTGEWLNTLGQERLALRAETAARQAAEEQVLELQAEVERLREQAD